LTTPETPEPELKEPELKGPELQGDAAEPSRPVRRRRRWRWLHITDKTIAAILIVLAALVVGGYFFASSAAFEEGVRKRLVTVLEDATGGRVEIAGFHWNLLHLRVEATGITIHGLEAAGEDPYAHVDRLSLQISLLNVFRIGTPTHVILREAEVVRPTFHLIVYPDGSTNQPHPKKPSKLDTPVMDTLFEAKIGKLYVEDGSAHIANEVVPLDLRAADTDVKLTWVPGPAHLLGGRFEGSYRIEAGLRDLSFSQGKFKPVSSRVDAVIDLLHDGARLESLRLRSLDQTLSVRGELKSFVHPEWKGEAHGDVDLRVLGPTIGFDNVRTGVVRLDASAHGKGAEFEGSGGITSKALHYQDSVVDAQTGDFQCSFHADSKQLLVKEIRVRLARGGELAGEFRYDNWLSNTPKPAIQRQLRAEKKTWPAPTGAVKATLNGVTLDTVLVMLASPQYQRLGLDTVVSGPASADWSGLGTDLEIGGQLAFTPSAKPAPGEVPVSGSTDATYHVDSGSVKLEQLNVQMPHSEIDGKGSLGVVPVDRASALDLNLKSSDLADFDSVLRTLGLTSGKRSGTAALPVRLHGAAEFHGQMSSSWLTPRVDGHLTASDISIQTQSDATAQTSTPSANPAAEPAFFHLDSVDLDAMYSPAEIVVRHGVLKRGSAVVSMAGRLDATDPGYNLQKKEAEFDEDSETSLKATVERFPLEELLPLAGVNEPVKGILTGQIDISGQLNALTGTGNLDVVKASVYGETIEHVHAAGSATGGALKITSLTAAQGAGGGTLTGSGSYDFAHKRFQIDARGAGIDLGSLQAVKKAAPGVSSKLGFTALGDGTLDDPRVQAKATLSSIRLGAEPVSDMLISASTRDRAVTYDLSSKQLAGEFTAHGTTRFDADYTTQAKLQFAKFDVGALLKLLKVTGINGQSDLEGTAEVSGPLAHPEKLNGDASLKTLAVSVENVHLQSKGPLHASLSGGIARLDPLEITGEDTDLKVGGTLEMMGKQQLDMKASGSINMRLAESLDPDLTASGVTSFQMEAHGPVSDPLLQGRVEFKNAAIALQDFPNGLSQIKGTLEFIQNRLEVRSLTAMSGGGQLSVGGYIGFQKGLYADLTAKGTSIRIRYPQGISSLADAQLKLQGPQNNLLLSGSVLVTRFQINSDLDLGSFAGTTGGGVQAIVSPDAPSNHLRLDVHLMSAPQLNFQNALAKLAGDVDLRIRGTLAAPSVLGKISLTEGSATFGGTKYELQRGDISFNNPVRIQPNIDLDATARVEDYDITLGLHGTTDKYNLTYRSEPPLPEADVIALLALGRTQDEQRAYSAQQQQAGDNPMTDALLGGALNATVSNRVQRLFGSGSIKVDPNYIGSLGNSTARITVVEQIGKNLTFTYASNVNTTTQQLIQAEIAVNRHVSLLVTQDESGIFSVVVKARRRYK
jgi:translocation and assembly module TamB